MITTITPKLPEGKRYAVCLTFDFDTFSFRIGRMKHYSPTLVSRGEFGNTGAQRIIDLLSMHGLKATFFTPGYTIETYQDTAKVIFRRGNEIAHHNYRHETPLELDREEESSIIDRANGVIEKLTGKKARGYRSPAWDLSANTLDLILEKGFIYDSSLMAHDYLPYYVRQGDEETLDGPFRFGRNTRMIEIPISWSLDDYLVFEFDEGSPGMGMKEGAAVERNWIADFDYMTRHLPTGVFTPTMHPQVIGRGHRMEVLENMINHVMKRDDVVFMTMEELARACM